MLAVKDGVGVIVLRDDKHVLLGLRKGAHGAGTWSFPGGHLEAGESLVDCAKREVLEETGLCLNGVTEGPVTRDFFEEIGVEYKTHFMIAKYTGGEPELKEPDKCEMWCWVSLDELIAYGDKLFKPIQSLLALNILP